MASNYRYRLAFHSLVGWVGLGLVVALGLGGCAAGPQVPQLLVAYERDMRQGQELALQGQLTGAHGSFIRALARARLTDNSGRIAGTLIALADIELRLDRTQEACPRFSEAGYEASLLQESAEGRRLVWQAALGQAECALRTAQPERVAPLLDDLPSLNLLDPTAATALHGHRLNQLALAALHRARLDDARTLIERAVSDAQLLGNTALLASSLSNRALIRSASGDVAGALADGESALALDRARQEPTAIAESHALLARLLQTGQPELARHHRQRAISIFKLTGQQHRVEKP